LNFDEERYREGARRHALPEVRDMSDAQLLEVIARFGADTAEDRWLRQVIHEEQERRRKSPSSP
jgi:hypothetical protein